MKKVYLDYAATTPVAPEVLEAMRPYLLEKYGNAGSLHSFGMEARDGLEKARASIAKFIGAKPVEIIFTGVGTESNNLALKGIAFANKNKGKHVITSKIEHPAIIEPCKWLEKQGFKVTEEELLEYCKKNLAPYKIPKIRFMDELPKTTTGKILKKELPRE